MDITERKTLEDQLSEQTRLLDLSYDAVIARDLENRITFWNKRAEEIYGYSRHEVLGKVFHELLHSEFPEPLSAISEKLDRDDRWSGEIIQTARGGKKITVLSRWTLDRDAKGRASAVLETDTDLTEQKKVLASLPYQAHLAKIIANGAAEALFLVDTKGRVTSMNPAAEKTFGWKEAELGGEVLYEILCAAASGAAGHEGQSLARALTEGTEARDVEDIFYTKSGAPVYVRCSSSPILQHGRVAGAVIAVSDITRKKRAQQALERSERRFRQIFENAATGIAITDTRGAFIQCNSVYTAIVGYSEEELKGLTFTDLVHPEDREANAAMIPKLMSGEIRSFEVQNRYLHKSGEPVWVHKVVSLMPGEDDGEPHMLALVTDVTERKRFEEALNESRARERAYMEHLPVGVWGLNAKGEIVYINQEAKKIWGGGEYVGIPRFGEYAGWWYGTGVKIEAEEWAAARAVRRGETSLNEVIDIECFDGTRKTILNSAVPLFGPEGEILGAVAFNQDITDQKRVERQLVESEERFRHLADAMPQLVWIADADGSVKYYNSRSREYHGLGKGGHDWQSGVHREDLPRTLSAWKKASEEGLQHQIEHRFMMADGSYRWHLTRAVPVRRKDGSVLWYGTVTDIHEIKQAGETLRRRVEEFERLFDIVPVAVWMAEDPECRVITGNRHANTLYEADAGDNVSATSAPEARRFFDPDGRELSAAELPMQVAAAENREVSGAEIHVVLPSGRKLVILGSAVPLRNEEGKVRGCIAAFMDITERKKMEAELNESRELLIRQYRELDSLYLASPVGLAVLDLEMRFIRINKRLAEMNGLSEAAHIGKTVGEIVPSIAPQVAAVHRRVLERGEMARIEVRGDTAAHPGIARMWEEYWYPLRKSSGEVFAVGVVIQDITDRKKAEEALLRTTEELKRSNQELEQFAYISSHDLQEPLRTISSYSDMLLMLYADKLDGEAKQNLAFIQDGALHAQSLIQALLSYAQITNKDYPFRLEDMGGLLRQALANLETLVNESGADVQSDRLPYLKVNGVQIVQLFQNLISNSIKYRSEERPRIRISAQRENDRWVFSVKDNGIGIAEEHLERVFKLFKRLHPRNKYPGTGIGLASSKKIVEKHGGEMWLRSAPGKGSTFYFSLPALEENA